MNSNSTYMTIVPQLSTTGDFSSEQKRYLEGFFAGVAVQGVTFGDVAGASVKVEEKAGVNWEDLTKEERRVRMCFDSSGMGCSGSTL